MIEPLYLAKPITDGHTYGRLTFQKDGYYLIHHASPAVLEMAKRAFPGCGVNRVDKTVRFRATRRAVGDLNWLLTRYPLRIDDPDRYEEHRQAAIRHAMRREINNAPLRAADPPPAFNGRLYPFQAEGVTYLSHNDRALLADDMGLGKTVTALAALASVGADPTLIVCPPNVRRQWAESARRFIGAGAEVLEGVTPRDLPRRPIYITSYNLLPAWREAIEDLGLAAVVFDEVQELRHVGTAKYSAASLIASGVDRVWGLSGTPIYNHGIEIWSVLNILDYHCLGDREAFTREWCTGYLNERVENPEALNDHLRREGLLLRRRKRDVLADLPPKHRVSHIIDHDADKYREMVGQAMSVARRFHNIRGWAERGAAATLIDRESRRATGVSKAPYVADFVSTLIEAGERPLIYAWHHDVHDLIEERLGWTRLGRITGKETVAAKARTVRAFAAGGLDGVLLSLRATAGIDGLQGRATTVVFAELDWSPAVHSQCEDRLHRVGIGKLDKVICYYLVSRTGYDGVVSDALGVKIGQFLGIMGDEAETEEDKVLANAKAEEHLRSVIDRLMDEGVETGKAVVA